MDGLGLAPALASSHTGNNRRLLRKFKKSNRVSGGVRLSPVSTISESGFHKTSECATLSYKPMEEDLAAVKKKKKYQGRKRLQSQDRSRRLRQGVECLYYNYSSP
jgi:hypothetical protein